MGLPTPESPSVVRIPEPGIKLEDKQVLPIPNTQETQLTTKDVEVKVKSFSVTEDKTPEVSVKSTVNTAVPESNLEITVPVVKAAVPVSVVESTAPIVQSAVPVHVVEGAVSVVEPGIISVPIIKTAVPATPVISPIPMVEATVSVPAPIELSAVLVSIVPEPLLAPEPPMPSVDVPFVGGKHHIQDEAGQYSFSHWGGPNTRVEIRNALGITSGSFAYINPDGDVQIRKYAAGPLRGFRVAASDLPDDTNFVVQDTPEVAKVKAAHAEIHAAARAATQAKAKADDVV